MFYKIVTADYMSELTRLVDALMKDGWVPTGGVFVSGTNGFGQPTEYSQAMVRPQDDR